MNPKRKALFWFLLSFVVFLLIFFLLPINIFDGEIVLRTGMGDQIIPRKLSLTYFLGLYHDPEAMEYVKSYHLTKQGILLAVLIIVGIPALLAYRSYLSNTKK